MPHFYRIRTIASPVATDLDVVDVLVADRAGSMADLATSKQRLLTDRDVVRSPARQPRREREAAFRADPQIVAAIVLDDEAAQEF